MNVTTADVITGRIRQVAMATFGSAVAVLLLLAGLRAATSIPLRPSVLLGVSVTFLLTVAVFQRTLTLATRHCGPQRLTVPTWITIGRSCALVVFAGVVTLSPVAESLQWVAVGLFTLSAVFDMIDGAVARRTGTVSEWGGRLDTEIDSLLVLVGTAAVVWLGRVPVVFLAVGVARYAFVAATVFRQRRGLDIAPLAPSLFRKFTGGAIMFTIWIALLPAVDTAVTHLLAWLVLIPILAHFLWDWLSVSGRFD